MICENDSKMITKNKDITLNLVMSHYEKLKKDFTQNFDETNETNEINEIFKFGVIILICQWLGLSK